MYEDGFHDITNVDYSDVVINKMRNRWKHLTEMEWMVADAQDLTFLLCSSFDVVLEKGTIDAMLVSEKDPWHISAVAERNIDLVMKQVGYTPELGFINHSHQVAKIFILNKQGELQSGLKNKCNENDLLRCRSVENDCIETLQETVVYMYLLLLFDLIIVFSLGSSILEIVHWLFTMSRAEL